MDLETLKTSCPSCTKQYSVAVQEIYNSSPQFQCKSCSVRFAFDMPDFIDETEETASVDSYLVSFNKMPDFEESLEGTRMFNAEIDNSQILEDFDFGQIANEANKSNDDQASLENALEESFATVNSTKKSRTEEGSVFKKKVDESLQKECPRCQFNNMIEDTDCRRCGVVLDKFKTAGELSFRSTKKVRDSWASVMESYEDEDRHAEFLTLCQIENTLPFAAHRYHAILQADPNEDIALKMRRKVIAMASTQVALLANSKSVTKKSLRLYGLVTFLSLLVGVLLVAASIGGMAPAYIKPLGGVFVFLSSAMFFLAQLRRS